MPDRFTASTGRSRKIWAQKGIESYRWQPLPGAPARARDFLSVGPFQGAAAGPVELLPQPQLEFARRLVGKGNGNHLIYRRPPVSSTPLIS